MHHVEIKQRMGEADIAAISVLLEVASAADGHRALGEHQWLDLVQGGREGFAGFVARETGRERVVAYAQVSRGNDGSWAVEYVVHPRWRENGAELQRDLLTTALGEIAAQGGGHVHLWVPKPTPIDDAVAEAVGMRRGRDLVQMRCALPITSEVADLVVRPFRPGSRRVGVAGGEQPGVSRPSRTGLMGSRHPCGAGGPALVRRRTASCCTRSTGVSQASAGRRSTSLTKVS